jgi:hypothetical protein
MGSPRLDGVGLPLRRVIIKTSRPVNFVLAAILGTALLHAEGRTGVSRTRPVLAAVAPLAAHRAHDAHDDHRGNGLRDANPGHRPRVHPLDHLIAWGAPGARGRPRGAGRDQRGGARRSGRPGRDRCAHSTARPASAGTRSAAGSSWNRLVADSRTGRSGAGREPRPAMAPMLGLSGPAASSLGGHSAGLPPSPEKWMSSCMRSQS